MANLLYDRLFGCHADSDKTFLHLADGRCLSYRELVATAARIAGVFSDAGLKPGDRVAVQVDKSPEVLALFAASVQSGIVFLPLNTAYTKDELAYFIENSGALLLVCDGAKADALRPLADRFGASLLTLNGDGTGSLMDAAENLPDSFETVDRDADNLAAFLYTSGTTGRSKAAMLTQGNLLSNAETLADYWQFTENDVLLHALPIFHTHGLFVATNVSLISGGSMVYMPKFNLDQIIDWMPRSTTMMGVPTFYTRLLDDDRFTADLARHMRLFVSGSAPLLAETHRQFETRTGHRILERYGMTETNMNTSNPYDGERRPGTVGFPLPGVELKITDAESGTSLPDGEIGQIEVRGPNVFKGYWQMPEKTAAELREDGFFQTGDLGRIDEDGYVHIVGRSKDLIISGGYNIYPKEIESLLDDLPGVRESAVIGVPHSDFGETPVGLVVAEHSGALDLDAMMQKLGELVASYKRPRRLFQVEELPRNTMGKVQKNLLRESYRTLFE